jgi:hypothetical protein
MAQLRGFWKQVLLLGIYATVHKKGGGGKLVAIKHFKKYTFQLQFKENKAFGPPKFSTQTQFCGKYDLNVTGL